MAKLHIKEATKWLLDIVKQLPAGDRNVEIYKEAFAGFKEKDWQNLLEQYQAGNFIFPLFIYNMSEDRIDEKQVMEVGEKIGIQYFQHLTLTDPVTGEQYTTPVKYLVLDLPMRRLIQHILDKMSTAKNDNVVDHVSGQATGDSKSSSISLPELGVLNANDLIYPALEFVKGRGGDEKAYDEIMKQIEETGSFSMDRVSELNSKPKIVESLRFWLLGTGIDNNL